MKTLIFVALALFSGSTFAACEVGQITTLKASVSFHRSEGKDKKLTVQLPQGSEVHIIDKSENLIELYAITQIQGQNLSFLSSGPANQMLKVLNCSE